MNIKLALLASLSIGTFYPIVRSFGEYYESEIPEGTFDIKIESKGSGATWTTKNTAGCYKCNAVMTFTNQNYKKILECVEGTCTETVYNTQTGKQIASDEMSR